jgi:two-component system, chemotaxis family, chemotaxis protein CheY
MNFLVVDDQSTMRSLVKGMLNKMGYKDVDEADDGSVGLDMLKQKPYGLVISDIHMTKMSGLEFLKETRSTSAIKDAKFMLVTTESSKAAVLEAIKYKVNGYILKPFTYEAFLEKMKLLGIEPIAVADKPEVQAWGAETKTPSS